MKHKQHFVEIELGVWHAHRRNRQTFSQLFAQLISSYESILLALIYSWLNSIWTKSCEYIRHFAFGAFVDIRLSALHLRTDCVRCGQNRKYGSYAPNRKISQKCGHCNNVRFWILALFKVGVCGSVAQACWSKVVFTQAWWISCFGQSVFTAANTEWWQLEHPEHKKSSLASSKRNFRYVMHTALLITENNLC